MPNMPDTETTSPETRQGVAFVLAVILFMLVLAAYWPVRGHWFDPYNDAEYLTGNPRVMGLTLNGVRWAFTTGYATTWHPLTWLSHMADFWLFGPHAGSQHLMSVFLHGLNAGLLLIVLTALLRTVWASLAAAVLFALHPANVEAVVWISQRKTLLSTFFLLLAIWAWSSYGRKRAAWSYGAALGCFTLALLSKPAVAMLPFLLLLLDAWPLRRATTVRGWGKLVVEKIPFFLLSAAMLMVILLVDHGRAMEEMRRALAYMWPFYPTGICQYPGKYFSWAMRMLPTAAALVLSVLALWSARRVPVVAIGWFWFLGTLPPVLVMVPMGLVPVAEHYFYLPFIGLCLMAGWFTASVHLRFKVRPSWVGAAFALLAVILMFTTQVRVRTWRSEEGLYHRNLADAPGSKDRVVLGWEYMRPARERLDSDPKFR
jgi:protein O-mannosyl-transferase